MSHEKSCRILKHVLKPEVSWTCRKEVACNKIVPCTSTFTGQKVEGVCFRRNSSLYCFVVQIQEFGLSEIRDLITNGRNISVTEENKKEYVKLVCQMKMTGAIRKQIDSFLEGFYEIIPKRLISIFNEQELELLISGLPSIDLDDLKSNSEYHKYNENSLQVCLFVCFLSKGLSSLPASLLLLTFSLPCFSVKIKHKICKNMNSVQQQREHHH